MLSDKEMELKIMPSPETKPSTIQCEVPRNHKLREDGVDKEQFVPIFEVTKQETTFTKGDSKLQRIVVNENQLEPQKVIERPQSKIPKLRQVFEKENDKNYVSIASRCEQDVSKEQAAIKPGNNINIETENEFDKIFEEIADEEVNMKKNIPVNIDDTENIDSEFDRIVKEYTEEEIKPPDTENVKTRIPFRKQKSLQEVLPKRAERRQSLEFKCMESEAIKISDKATECNDITKKQNYINSNYLDTASNRPKEIYTTEEISKDFRNSEVDKHNDVPITKIADEEVHLENNTSVTIKDTENINPKFDRIVEDHKVENKISDTEQVNTRIPFRKQKSLQDVLPKTTERRPSLREITFCDESEASKITMKATEYKSITTKEDNINFSNNSDTARKSPKEEYTTEEISKDFLNSKVIQHNETPIKRVIITNENKISTKTDDVTKTSDRNITEDPLKADLKKITSYRKDLKETTKHTTNVNEPTAFSIASRIAIFENRSSKDDTKSRIPIPKPRQRATVTDLSTESIPKAVVIDEVIKAQLLRHVAKENTSNNKLDEINLFKNPEETQTACDLKIEYTKEIVNNPPKLNAICENIDISESVVKYVENPLNIIEFEDEVVVAKEELSSKTSNNNNAGSQDLEKPFVVKNGKTVDNESNFRTGVKQNQQSAYKNNEKELLNPIKTKQVTDTNKRVLRQLIEAKNNTLIDNNHKFLANKTIPVLQTAKALTVFENKDNMKVNEGKVKDTKHDLRRKSATELEIEDKMKGKVKTIIVKMKSFENLSNEKTELQKPVINAREMPRRKSVSDKKALFETKNFNSPRI